jgi:hypothetical protein
MPTNRNHANRYPRYRIFRAGLEPVKEFWNTNGTLPQGVKTTDVKWLCSGCDGEKTHLGGSCRFDPQNKRRRLVDPSGSDGNLSTLFEASSSAAATTASAEAASILTPGSEETKKTAAIECDSDDDVNLNVDELDVGDDDEGEREDVEGGEAVSEHAANGVGDVDGNLEAGVAGDQAGNTRDAAVASSRRPFLTPILGQPRVSGMRMPLTYAWALKKCKKLPKCTDGKIKAKQKPSMALRAVRYPLDSITDMSAENSECFWWPKLEVVVVNIGAKHPELFCEPKEFVCPCCNNPNTDLNIRVAGYTKDFRIVHDTSSILLVLQAVYQHNGCPASKAAAKSSTFLALNPKVVAQYDPRVRMMYPFLFTHRSGVTDEMLYLMKAFTVDATGSYRAFELYRSEQLERWAIQADKMQAYNQMAKAKLGEDGTLDGFPKKFTLASCWFKERRCFHPLSRKVAREFVFGYLSRNQPLWDMHTSQISAPGEGGVRYDLTFYIATLGAHVGGGGEPFAAMLTVSNMTGDILLVRFLRGKSNDELKPILIALRKQIEKNNWRELRAANELREVKWTEAEMAEQVRVRVVSTDNPRVDEKFIKEVWGDDVIVQDDLFHMLQKIFRTTLQNPVRPLFMGEFSRAALRPVVEDLLVVSRRLIASRKVELPESLLALSPDELNIRLDTAAEHVVRMMPSFDGVETEGLVTGEDRNSNGDEDDDESDSGIAVPVVPVATAVHAVPAATAVHAVPAATAVHAIPAGTAVPAATAATAVTGSGSIGSGGGSTCTQSSTTRITAATAAIAATAYAAAGNGSDVVGGGGSSNVSTSGGEGGGGIDGGSVDRDGDVEMRDVEVDFSNFVRRYLLGVVRRVERERKKKYAPYVRTSMPPKDELAKAWTDIGMRYLREHPKMFNSKAFKTIFDMIERVKDGYLSDAVYAKLFTNVGTEEVPRYKNGRGTSPEESFHSILKRTVKARHTIVMVDLLARHAEFRQNFQRQRRDRGMRVGKFLLDPTLLNDYVTVMADLKCLASIHGWAIEVR